MANNLAPNYTGRYFVEYRTLGHKHHIAFRYAGEGAPSSAFVTEITGLLTAIKGLRFTDWEPTGASYIAKDATLSFPLAIPAPDAGTVSLGDGGVNQWLHQVTFPCRSTAGKKGRLHFYGLALYPFASTLTPQQDFRVTVAEDARVAVVVAALEAATNIVGPDGNPVYWHQYANISPNAMYMRKSRG